MYYVCDHETLRVIYGPYSTSNEVAAYITGLPKLVQKKYCNMSRYLLDKKGKYPKGKRGDEKIAADLRGYPPVESTSSD